MKTAPSIILFYVLPLLVCSCSAPLPYKFPLGPSMEELIESLPVEERTAIVETSDRDPATGQFKTPIVSPFGGAPVVSKRWIYTDANGRTFFGNQFSVNKPKPSP